MDLQAFGNSSGASKGELWIYGNVFRNLSTTAKLDAVLDGLVRRGTGNYKLYFFNNTFDMNFGSNADGIWKACTETATLVVEKNNAYWNGTTNINTHDTPAATAIRQDEFCSTSDTACSVPSQTTRNAWWNYPALPGLFNALPAYVTKIGGPLDNVATNNPCDPDGDGTAGVDYNWDGVNDTTWTDIAGNTVSCPTAATPLERRGDSVGARGPRGHHAAGERDRGEANRQEALGPETEQQLHGPRHDSHIEKDAPVSEIVEVHLQLGVEMMLHVIRFGIVRAVELGRLVGREVDLTGSGEAGSELEDVQLLRGVVPDHLGHLGAAVRSSVISPRRTLTI
jgi:hypothetical protein